jgi:hypothetical protein
MKLQTLLEKAQVVASAVDNTQVQELFSQISAAVEEGREMTACLHYGNLLEAAGTTDSEVSDFLFEHQTDYDMMDEQTVGDTVQQGSGHSGPIGGHVSFPLTSGSWGKLSLVGSVRFGGEGGTGYEWVPGPDIIPPVGPPIPGPPIQRPYDDGGTIDWSAGLEYETRPLFDW